MSQDAKDVSVCFRPPLKDTDAVLLTHRVLQEFPIRVQPQFRPWFPSASDALKPLKPAPLISSEDLQSVSLRLEEPADASDQRRPAERPKRSWCAIADRRAPQKITRSFSRLFQKTVEKHALHLRQRVKWVVCERNCGPRGMEELWLDLNRAIRRSRLPTCNANYQRALAQIWLYCDVFYSEYIGNLLKQEFQLSGQITLTCHRLGDIVKL
ncbi:shieldin complex subunit 3-like [Carassius auratus]|uniref:Shieldin complex subunit 3-like n=1 Tax=Carassius auratus TaxID=7957 RepID=A0A6P6KKP5_CARAU|nr:shieldin complex subunit 3-like [Carassius auratus]